MNMLSQTLSKPPVQTQRRDCVVCGYHLNQDDMLVSCACNVREFIDQEFKLWRCPQCDSIHCLDVVNLDDYYANYPIASSTFSAPYKVVYNNILKRFKQVGLAKHHAFLDYGCGANGLFLQFLRRNGYTNARGFDPYGDQASLGNPATLERGKFDYILLQDVIEHVEEPDKLLSQLDDLLAPGGYILIGTPNASNLDLDPVKYHHYRSQIHAPYHLHLYTRAGLEALGQAQGWQPVHFLDGFYADTRWPMLNYRTLNYYPQLFDGAMDCLYEAVTWKRALKAMTSPKFWMYALFGYWLSHKTNMAVVFRKDDGV
jgi:SAM-dependent methyltransferase